MMADLEPEDKLFTNEDHMIRIPGTMLTQFSFFPILKLWLVNIHKILLYIYLIYDQSCKSTPFINFRNARRKIYSIPMTLSGYNFIWEIMPLIRNLS